MLEFLAFLHVTIWPLVVVLAICGALIVYTDWRSEQRANAELQMKLNELLGSYQARVTELSARVGKLELQRGIKG